MFNVYSVHTNDITTALSLQELALCTHAFALSDASRTPHAEHLPMPAYCLSRMCPPVLMSLPSCPNCLHCRPRPRARSPACTLHCLPTLSCMLTPIQARVHLTYVTRASLAANLTRKHPYPMLVCCAHICQHLVSCLPPVSPHACTSAHCRTPFAAHVVAMLTP